MKKILLVIIMLFLSISVVKAKDNKLSISSIDNKLYYDSSKFDSEIFMHHLDMIPGNEFSDELVIENETKYTFNLYLKIKKRNNNELLDYLSMKIYLNDLLIYNGDMLGTSNESGSVKLSNYYLVGTFTPNRVAKIRVETKFSDEYSNMSNEDPLIIDWSFYAETFDDLSGKDDVIDNDDSEIIEILPAPVTGMDINTVSVIAGISGLCIGIAIIFIILTRKKRNG